MIHRTSLRDVTRYAVVGFAAVLLIAAPLTMLPRALASDLVVNGHTLNDVEERHVRWIADKTYDRLQGSREDRLEVLATVTWWSLKEGVLDLENPHAYSNCLDGGQDTHYPPTKVCQHQVWQVGLSGVQVNNFSTSAVESRAVELYPSSTVDEVLSHTLDYAGYPPDSDVAKTVMNSGELLRRSWLLKNHGVGFSLQYGTVKRECVDGAESWCFGTGWDTSEWYAPTKDAAMGAIKDLRDIMATLTSDSSAQPENPGSDGATAKVWDTGGVGLHVRSAPDTDSAVLATLNTGDSITISCQVEGPKVHNDVAGVTSTLWDYLPKYQGYVADAWVYTGTNGRIDGVPDCNDSGTEPPTDPDDPGPGDPSDCSGDAPAFPDGSPASDVVAAMEERWGLDFKGDGQRSWEDGQYLPLLKVWWNTLAKVECTSFVKTVNQKNGGALAVVATTLPNDTWGWYKGHPTGLHIDVAKQLGAVENVPETVEQNIIHELGHAYNNDRDGNPDYWTEYVGIYESEGGLTEYGRTAITENFADVLGFYVARCAMERFSVDPDRPNPYDGGYASYYEFAKNRVFDGVEFGPGAGTPANC